MVNLFVSQSLLISNIIVQDLLTGLLIESNSNNIELDNKSYLYLNYYFLNSQWILL